MDVPPLIYIGLLVLVIVSGVMTNISKYGWKSRGWTWFFAVLGAGSMLVLMIIVISSI
jgi:hypothetical protein